MMLTLWIPGKVMSEFTGSGVYQGEIHDALDRELHDALRGARMQRRGRGERFEVTMSAEAWGLFADYVDTFAVVSADDATWSTSARSTLSACRKMLATLAGHKIHPI